MADEQITKVSFNATTFTLDALGKGSELAGCHQTQFLNNAVQVYQQLIELALNVQDDDYTGTYLETNSGIKIRVLVAGKLTKLGKFIDAKAILDGVSPDSSDQ